MKKIFLVLTFIILLSLFFTVPVFAEGENSRCVLCGAMDHDYDKLSEKGSECYVAYGFYEMIYGDMFDESVAIGGVSFQSLLTFKTNNNQIYELLMENVSTIYDAIAILGCLWVFIYYLLQLAEVSMEDGFTYETFTRLCIRTLIAFIIIKNGMMLISSGITLCVEMFDKINYKDPSLIGYPFTKADCPYTTLMELNNPLFAAWGMILKNLIPYAATLAAKLILFIILYSRLIEVTVRIMFAPIGMADIFHNGVDSEGIKYFKKLMAVVLQGVCIAGVFLAYSYINSLIRNSVAGYIGSIVLAFALISLVRKTQDIAMDVIG